MDVTVTLECRFEATPDGKVWQQSQFPYEFWARYLQVFEGVKVVARVREVEEVPANWLQCNGEGVSFVKVPYYVGPWQYLRQARQVSQTLKAAVAPDDAVILRVYSNLARCLVPFLLASRHPYGVEVVSDPFYLFAPGANQHPLRPFFRYWFTRITRQHCKQAVVASYVTKAALQKQYPCAGFTTHYSSIQLKPKDFVPAPRSAEYYRKESFRLIHVGTLQELYKAQDVLIEAVALCLKQGIDLQLDLVGEGKHKAELEQHVANLGLQDHIHFLGQLTSGPAVFSQLDQADLFVLPSRQEGLPRAMIEAMARGLPCLGSAVNGIPELIGPEDLVPPGDVATLAAKISEVLADPDRLARMSARNLVTAKDYEEEVLRERRLAFYSFVRDKMETGPAVEKTG